MSRTSLTLLLDRICVDLMLEYADSIPKICESLLNSLPLETFGTQRKEKSKLKLCIESKPYAHIRVYIICTVCKNVKFLLNFVT